MGILGLSQNSASSTVGPSGLKFSLSVNFCVSLGVWGIGISDTLLCHSGTERKLRALSSPAKQPIIFVRTGGFQIFRLKGKTTSLSSHKSLDWQGKEQDSHIISNFFCFFSKLLPPTPVHKGLFALAICGWGKDGRDGWLNSLLLMAGPQLCKFKS